MGTVTKLNNVLCANISKVNDTFKNPLFDPNISKWDDNTFCPASPTPTPTVTVTPTPTPTQSPAAVTPTPTPTITPSPVPCDPGCCERELCFGSDCNEACNCANTQTFYLHQPCDQDPCDLAYADGIFDDDRCSVAARPAYFSDGSGDCWYWDGTTLTYSAPC